MLLPHQPKAGERARISSESRRAARRSGLRYVSDAFPGITRQRVGTGWAFYLPTGRRIVSAPARRRLLSLAVPPAWTDVWICNDPLGHMQVTARDARGRKQYRYHPAYRATRTRSKFRRILEFSDLLPRIRERVERDLSSPSLSRPQVLATLVRLLDRTFIRIGNVEYARQNRSFGLTTLRDRHVEVRGSTLRFAFRGKSRVEGRHTLTDRRLARVVRQLQDLPGQELFQYLDKEGVARSVSSGDVNQYLRHITRRDVTAKDFRTWAGTMLAARALCEVGATATAQEAKLRVNQAIDLVAKRLGNTRTVCRQYYIHPVILDAYLAGSVVPLNCGPRPQSEERSQASLRREELEVLQFLQGWEGGSRDKRPAAMTHPA